MTTKNTENTKDHEDRDLREELDLYVQAAQLKKAEGLLVLDVRDQTSIADAFIICSGRSNRQVSAIAESIKEFLREHNIRPLHVEGIVEGHWVLLDYGHVIIHVFYETTRSFYDLEGLWANAHRITTKSQQLKQPKNRTYDGEEIIVE